MLNLQELIDAALQCYQFTKAEMNDAHGDQYSVRPMLVVYDGRSITLGELAAPEVLRHSLVEMTDKQTQAVVFHADTSMTWLGEDGLPTDAAQVLLTIGCNRELTTIVQGTTYFKTEAGLMFEPTPPLDIRPFAKEVELLQSVFR